jgi:hypothetical protein
MIHACALRAIDARTFEKTSRSSQIWALAATTRLVVVSSSTVLKAPIKNSQGFKSGDLGGWRYFWFNHPLGTISAMIFRS